MTLIKVIIPVYKTENCLERCINSILAQTEQAFEIILIDDGSPDQCPEICNRYAKKDSRIHVIHQTNQGLSAARNAGMDYMSDCEYITFIDSDDWVHPRYFETLLTALKNTGCLMAISGHQKTNWETPAVDETKLVPAVYSAEECYCLTSVSTTPAWGKIYRTSLLQNMRFPVNKIHEDYYTTWKILFQLKEIAVITQPLYFYYVNREGIMHSMWTPKRMDVFPAMEEKIQYFHKHHLEKAEKRAIFKRIKTIDKYISLAEKTAYAAEYVPKLQQLKKDCLNR